MKILAIETSCDDTAVAVLEITRGRFKILSNIISSQVKLHAKYGGVYPMLAKREHQRNLPIVLNKALRRAGFVNIKYQKGTSSFYETANTKKGPNIDLIAVTVGPGLEPCLWVGVNFANELAKKLNLPIIPINHVEAHLVANFVRSNFQFPISNFQKIFPAIGLVVSGGHTQLILMKNFGEYKILGETRDDAAGECFDKTARILGLGYPGGPAIAAEAARHKPKAISYKPSLPRPMIYHKNYDFSFSGLKTAVLYKVKGEGLKAKDKKYIQAMCWEIQQAIIDVLIHKTLKAAKDFKAKSIILGGGVAANKELRKQFKSAIKKELPNILYLIPDISFCTDNALMIAATAYFHFLKKKPEVRKEMELPRPRRDGVSLRASSFGGSIPDGGASGYSTAEMKAEANLEIGQNVLK